MKIEWNQIENFTDPGSYQKAIDLIDASGESLVLKEQEQGLYTLSFAESESKTDIEIAFGHKYLKNYSCDQHKDSKKICAHIIAGIILYRRNKTPKPITRSHQESLPSRISIKSILDQIPSNDLHLFLMRYSRLDKQFGQALKLHFASKIQVSVPGEKYRQLIDSMARLKPNANGQYSRQSVQSLFWVCEELLEQADDLIAIGNPTEAFAILLELLIKLASIYRKLEYHYSDYEKFWILIHQGIRKIYETELAPDFRTEINTILLGHFAAPSYPFIHSPHNLYELLFPSAEYEFRNQLNALLIPKIQRKDSNPIPLVALFKMTLRYEREDLLVLASDSLDEPMRWITALEHLSVQNKDFACRLGHWMMAQISSDYWKYRLMDKLLFWQPENQHSIEFAKLLTSKTLEEKYIQFLFSQNVPVAEIIHAIQSSSNPLAVRVELDIYIKEKMFGDAKTCFEMHATLGLLQSLDHVFLAIDPTWVEIQYKKLLTDYLSEYAGPASQSKVQNIISHLQMIRAISLAGKLQYWIKSNFQSHLSITEN